MKILFADDNARMRDVIRTLLNGLKAELIECSDGEEAVAACAQHRPQWALLDIEMPRRDGLSAAREIARVSPRTTVIIVTAFDNPALRRAAAEAGACDYVLKENLPTLIHRLQAEQARASIAQEKTQ